MKKRGSILVLTSLACTMLLASCGGTSNPEVSTYELSIEKDNGVSTVQIYEGDTEVSDLTRIEEGTELKAVITLVDGYETTAVTLNDEAITTTDGTYLFEMPSEDSTLSVTTEQTTGLITVNNDSEKGTYTLTVGEESLTDNEFEVGDEVTLSVTANEGYELASVKVDGTEVTLTEGSYTFETTKTAYVIDITYNELYKVSLNVINQPSNGFYSSAKVFVGNEEVTSEDYFESGTEVKVVLTAANEYNNFVVDEYRNVPAYIYLHVNDDVYYGNDRQVASVSADSSTLTFTLTIESEDLDINVAYNGSKIIDTTATGVNFEFEPNEYIEVYGYSKDDKYDGTYFTPVLKRAPGYKVTGITLTDEEGNERQLSEASLPMFKNNVSSSFGIMGNYTTGTVKVKISGEMTTERTITYVGLESVTASSSSSFDTSLIAGDYVSMGGITCNDPTKAIKDIKFEGVETYASQGYDGSWSYGFEMPEGNVTITFEFEDLQALTYEENANIESVVFRSSSSTWSEDNIITHGQPGATVYAFIKPKSGYLLKSVTDQDGTELSIQYDYTGLAYVAATVGDNGLKLSFELGISYTVTVDEASKEYISTNLASGETAAEGATYTFQYNVINYAKKVNEVYLTNEEGERLDIEIKEESSYYSTTYSFVMPDCNVIICYDLVDNQKYPTTFNFTSADGEDVSTLITSLMIRNDLSGVSISEYSANLTGDLYEGTNTQVMIGLNVGYEATGTYTYTENGKDVTEELEISSAYNNVINFLPFYTPAGIKSVDIVISKSTPLSATVTHDSTLTDAEFNALDITYYVNDKEVTSFTNNVYSGDTVNIEINSEAEEGYVYQFKVTDADGELYSGSANYGYRVDGAFIFTISKVKAYEFSVVNNLSDYGFVSCSIFLSDGSYASGDEYQSSLIYGDNLTATIHITYASKPLDYVVTVGGNQVASGSLTESESSYGGITGETSEFAVTGNVVITFSDHVSA